MLTRALGAGGPQVSALGLGCMGMSDLYGPPIDRAEALATIRAALDAGVILLDTGDFYGMGHNELLIGEAIQGRARESVILSVKFGAQRDPAGAWLGFDGRPAAVKTALAYSLKRLNVDYVDIYRLARVDPKVPIEETIGAVADMVRAGFVRHIGLSEAGSETLRRAAAIHPICDLQIEYSLMSRGVEATLLPTCRALGVAITAYGVLGRGLISGRWRTQRTLAQGDFRATLPRFRGANLEHNLALVTLIETVAEAKGASAAQIAITWALAQGADIVPLVGARSRAQLAECLGALKVSLSAADLAMLDRAFSAEAVAGARYGEAQMAHLDSERG